MTTVHPMIGSDDAIHERAQTLKDVTANFIRFGGVAAIFAGAFMGFADLYHAVAEMFITEYSGSPTEQIGSVIFLIGRVLVVFALPALYLYHASSAGKFGFLAFTLAMLGNTLMVASDWSDVFIGPVLRDLDPSLFEEPPARIMVGFMINFIPETLGWLLLGISAFRARVFPRAASILLMFGVVLAFVGPSWSYVVLYAAVVWMGAVAAQPSLS